MSVGIVCPSCHAPLTIHRAPVPTECPSCAAVLPSTLREATELALLRQRFSRPLLLTAGMYVAPVFGGLFLLGVLAAVFDAGFFTFTINDRQVRSGQFLGVAGLLFAAIGVSSLASAYGIWREQWWARWAMLSFWIVVLAGSVGLGWSESGLAGATSAVGSMLVPIVLAVWYLFGRKEVVAYYRMLEREDDAKARRQAEFSRGA